MLGHTLAHYKILEKIGSGGMGEVYLAEDTKLDRKIALKVLPAELAESDERRARFEREAKAIAALNHPNIITVPVDGGEPKSISAIPASYVRCREPLGGLLQHSIGKPHEFLDPTST